MKEYILAVRKLEQELFNSPHFSRGLCVSFNFSRGQNRKSRSLLRNRTETLVPQVSKTSLNVMGPWFYWGIATIKEQENLGLKWKQSTT